MNSISTLIYQLNARVAQLVERQPSKLNVAGSNPVSRSLFYCRCSSGVERFLGKEEVTSSNLVIGSLIIKELQNKYLTLHINKGTLGEQIGSFLVPFFFSSCFLS